MCVPCCAWYKSEDEIGAVPSLADHQLGWKQCSKEERAECPMEVVEGSSECENLLWLDTGQMPGTHGSHLLTLFCNSWAEEREKINEGHMS